MKKRNKLNPSIFGAAREALEKAFPYQGLKRGFFIKDFKNVDAFPQGMRDKASGAVVESRGSVLTLRVYRDSDEAHLKHDVDEYRAVDRAVIDQPAKGDIENHHITHSQEEDMMARNHMTVEYVSDGKGGIQPNIGPDGMVQTYVNFPDPTEEILRRAKERGEDTKGSVD